MGGYNSFWLDPGSTFTMVNGEARTSIVVDPSDGKLPPLTPAARQRLGALLARPSAENDPGLDPTPGAYDAGERCLLGFGSAAGPPALPNYFYNPEIVQAPDRVCDPPHATNNTTVAAIKRLVIIHPSVARSSFASVYCRWWRGSRNTVVPPLESRRFPRGSVRSLNP